MDTSYDIWVMSYTGGDQRNLINLPAWDEYAAWSPDGSRIAFVSTGITDGKANSEVFVRESDGTTYQVTFNKRADEWPSWSPDGQWLANSSNRHGDMDIYVYRTDGSNIIQFTKDPAHDEQPVWSPDGQWIAFIRTGRDRGYPGNLFIGRRDGSEFRQLTFDNSVAGPAWSPDGRYIVVAHYWDSSGEGGIGFNDAGDLWAIPVDGGQPVVLLEGPERDENPDWTW
jgi:TolB protein